MERSRLGESIERNAVANPLSWTRSVVATWVGVRREKYGTVGVVLAVLGFWVLVWERADFFAGKRRGIEVVVGAILDLVFSPGFGYSVMGLGVALVVGLHFYDAAQRAEVDSVPKRNKVDPAPPSPRTRAIHSTGGTLKTRRTRISGFDEGIRTSDTDIDLEDSEIAAGDSIAGSEPRIQSPGSLEDIRQLFREETRWQANKRFENTFKGYWMPIEGRLQEVEDDPDSRADDPDTVAEFSKLDFQGGTVRVHFDDSQAKVILRSLRKKPVMWVSCQAQVWKADASGVTLQHGELLKPPEEYVPPPGPYLDVATRQPIDTAFWPPGKIVAFLRNQRIIKNPEFPHQEDNDLA
jgi:hypothetical protein